MLGRGSAKAACVGIAVLLGAAAAASAAMAAPPPVSGLTFGEPLPNLGQRLQAEFELGFALFTKVWSIEEGWGPLASARSCVACHATPMPGGSGTTTRTFALRTPGVRSEVFARLAVGVDGSLTERPAPPAAVRRKAPPLFGLGLLEAVPVEVLARLADPRDGDGNGVSGRLNGSGAAGRFGWKGSVARLEEFIARALDSELGLSADPHRQRGRAGRAGAYEVDRRTVRLLAGFVRLLAAPPRGRATQDNVRGRELFERAGCAACHRPELRAGPSRVRPLAWKVFGPYTDLLLHDMGSDLADGIVEGDASPTEFRTPPLWGLGSTGPPFLHDGRAESLDEAIHLHGGEAGRAARGYRGMLSEERHRLIAFLRSL